jgi:hypothetical protein
MPTKPAKHARSPLRALLPFGHLGRAMGWASHNPLLLFMLLLVPAAAVAAASVLRRR